MEERETESKYQSRRKEPKGEKETSLPFVSASLEWEVGGSRVLVLLFGTRKCHPTKYRKYSHGEMTTEPQSGGWVSEWSSSFQRMQLTHKIQLRIKSAFPRYDNGWMVGGREGDRRRGQRAAP